MRRVARALVAALVLLSPATGVEAQSARYKDILDQYRSGRFDEAVAALLELDPGGLDRERKALVEANAFPFRREARDDRGAPRVLRRLNARPRRTSTDRC